MAEQRETGGPAPRPNPNENLVKVFDTESESEAMVVKGLLESAGIDSDLTSTATSQEPFAGLGGVMILVREEDAESAKNILAEFQQNPSSDDDETSEINISTGEPPAKA